MSGAGGAPRPLSAALSIAHHKYGRSTIARCAAAPSGTQVWLAGAALATSVRCSNGVLRTITAQTVCASSSPHDASSCGPSRGAQHAAASMDDPRLRPTPTELNAHYHTRQYVGTRVLLVLVPQVLFTIQGYYSIRELEYSVQSAQLQKRVFESMNPMNHCR